MSINKYLEPTHPRFFTPFSPRHLAPEITVFFTKRIDFRYLYELGAGSLCKISLQKHL